MSSNFEADGKGRRELTARELIKGRTGDTEKIRAIYAFRYVITSLLPCFTTQKWQEAAPRFSR
jgi:hypothetical protein